MKRIFSMISLALLLSSTYAQVNKDSLWGVWQNTSLPDSTRFKALNIFTFKGYIFSDPDTAIHFADLHFNAAGQKNDTINMANALNNKGIAYYVKSEFDTAIQEFKQALELYLKVGDNTNSGNVFSNIGLIYSSRGNYPMALRNLKQGLKIHEKAGNKISEANTLNNIGLIYKNLDNYDQALKYFLESKKLMDELGEKGSIAALTINMGLVYESKGEYEKAMQAYVQGLSIAREVKNKNWAANALVNIGLIHQKNEEFDKALEHFEQALLIRDEMNDKGGIASVLYRIGKIYNSRKQYGNGKMECLKSLKLAEESQTLLTQKQACECLYNAYKGLGESVKALSFHERMLVLSDSLQSEETAKQLQLIEFEKEAMADSLKQEEEKLLMQLSHQEEVRKKNRQRNVLIGSGIILILIAGGFYRRWRFVRKSRDLIAIEKDRSENLLLNILPEEIAQELKEKGKADAREFDSVTILFTDFVSFTEVASKLDPSELVEEINTCFEAFDRICEKYNIEKIKTIGDAYMAAGGLPVPSDDSVKNTVLAALEMQSFMRGAVGIWLSAVGNASTESQTPKTHRRLFEMRVGIHTGPVVAGIVGVKKFQYDIWGDTVNTASRVESEGEVGKVNLSYSTYEKIKNDPNFTFESRGNIEAKGKGQIEMFFVNAL